MIGRVLRILFGFLLACLAVGFVQTAFVMPPPELLALPENVRYERLADAGILGLVATTQTAIFAAPFALVAAAIAEWQGLRSLLYYLFVGLAIAAGGFAAIVAAEPSGETATILNSYASTAFGLSGAVGAFVYWLLAGRLAGELEYEEEFTPINQPTPPKAVRPAATVPQMRAPVPPPATPPGPSSGGKG